MGNAEMLIEDNDHAELIKMIASLMIPMILVLNGKWKWGEVGFCKYDAKCSKKAYHFLFLLPSLE